jgi:predicted lipid carrier protein YhbT
MPAIPSFRLPTVIGRVGAHLPQWPHSAALCIGLNLAVRAGLLPAESLAALEGRRFQVVVEDAAARATFRCEGGVFRPADPAQAAPDLVFRATLSAYLRLVAGQEDPDTLFFRRELALEGDTELGLEVKNMLDAVDWAGLSPLGRWSAARTG